MSYFPGLKLTKAGEQLLAKVNGNLNETINFKRAELGSGVINTDDEIRFLTTLKEKWKDVNISDCKIVGTDKTQVQIELQFDNTDISTNKIFRELGIYAAANDGAEVLFAYSNAKENFDYIPAVTDNPQSFVINILITITSNTKVDAQIDLNSYVTLRKLQEELDKKLEKGNVSTEYDTAEKIENKIKTKLNQGNVPDVLNSAEKIIKVLQGNTGIKFDENLLYLNDSGTKKKGYCYLDKLTDGIFECIQGTTTTVNNATYFKNFSNKENADRLSNLIKIFQKNDWLVKEYNNNYIEAYSTLTAPGVERAIDLPVTIDTSKPFAAFANVIYINSHEIPSAAEVQFNSGKQLVVFNSSNKSTDSGAYVFVKVHGFIA